MTPVNPREEETMSNRVTGQLTAQYRDDDTRPDHAAQSVRVQCERRQLATLQARERLAELDARRRRNAMLAHLVLSVPEANRPPLREGGTSQFVRNTTHP